MYGHDGASNNVAPNRTIVYSEQHCCWPNHDHTLGVAGNIASQQQWCLVYVGLKSAGGMWTTEPKYAPTLQQSSN